MDLFGWLLRVLKTFSLIVFIFTRGITAKFWGLMLSQPLQQSDFGDASLDAGSPSNDTVEVSSDVVSSKHQNDFMSHSDDRTDVLVN